MSLLCGSCRTEISENFGLLYWLERDENGNLHLPNQAEDYVPPNSAICNVCWAKVPERRKLTAERATVSPKQIFAYAFGSSDNGSMSGSKMWSGIVVNEKSFIFLTKNTVTLFLMGAVEIIE